MIGTVLRVGRSVGRRVEVVVNVSATRGSRILQQIALDDSPEESMKKLHRPVAELRSRETVGSQVAVVALAVVAMLRSRS